MQALLFRMKSIIFFNQILKNLAIGKQFLGFRSLSQVNLNLQLTKFRQTENGLLGKCQLEQNNTECLFSTPKQWK